MRSRILALLILLAPISSACLTKPMSTIGSVPALTSDAAPRREGVEPPVAGKMNPGKILLLVVGGFSVLLVLLVATSGGIGF